MKNDKTGQILAQLTQVIESRKQADPKSSYVAKLLHRGTDEILKKIGEEATEVVIAAKNQDKDNTIYEVADLWFHCLVLLTEQDLCATQVLEELERRFGLSGIEEKNARPPK